MLKRVLSVAAVAALAYVAVSHGVVLAEEAAAVAPSAAPSAAAQIVTADTSPWQTFWAQLQAPLLTFAMAVLAAGGTILTYFVNKYAGARASQAANSIYQLAIDQAAGWLKAHLLGSSKVAVANAGVGGTSVPAGTRDIARDVASMALNGAVDYATKSYPAIVKKLGVPSPELAHDIVGALGKIAGPELAGPLDVLTKLLPPPVARR